MDDQRAQTLEALEEFIQAQRTLLSRTRSDIERLRELKRDVVEDPSDVLYNLSERLDAPAFRISEQGDCTLGFSKKIEWEVFHGRDATPLQDLNNRVREANIRQRTPSKFQLSELSFLQKLVKNARTVIVDPIIARYGNVSDPEPEDDEDIDPEALAREREREKIRELKKRQIQGCGLKLPGRGMAVPGVFIRHDVEDQSMDVDISSVNECDVAMARTEERLHPTKTKMELDEGSEGRTRIPDVVPAPPSRSSATPSENAKLPSSPSAAARSRRPTKKRESQSQSQSASVNPTNGSSDVSRPRKRVKLDDGKKKAAATSDATPPSVEGNTPKQGPSSSSSKPKPETYKQAWSVSEQHLLEQLLEEIPDGEKFRWQKISKAMGGRRTPRQVASRVQKYFEKLKRFGVG